MMYMKLCAAVMFKVLLFDVFYASCKNRETVFSKEDMLETFSMIEKDAGMAHI